MYLYIYIYIYLYIYIYTEDPCKVVNHLTSLPPEDQKSLVHLRIAGVRALLLSIADQARTADYLASIQLES